MYVGYSQSVILMSPANASGPTLTYGTFWHRLKGGGAPEPFWMYNYISIDLAKVWSVHVLGPCAFWNVIIRTMNPRLAASPAPSE